MPDIIITSQFILQSSVANAATFAIAYPAGETQASMQARSFDTINLLSSGGRTYTGMTASYGAGSITLTNGSGYTLPAGTYYVEFANPVEADDAADGRPLAKFATDAFGNVTGLVGPDGRRDLATIMIAQSAVPAGIPSSGSIAANGALSGITALSITYPGIWLYFPAGAVYAGSVAGFYWTVMSSTTAGTIYDNRLSGTESPYVPASPTPIVAAGPGAYTQTTGSALTICTHTIPGGAMGIHGALTCIPITRNNNSAGTKQIHIMSGATSLISHNFATSVAFRLYVETINRGVANVQMRTNWGGFSTSNSDFITTNSAINTAADWPVTHQLQIAVATDTIVLERLYISLTPRD